jgi:hypothetical protein
MKDRLPMVGFKTIGKKMSFKNIVLSQKKNQEIFMVT